MRTFLISLLLAAIVACGDSSPTPLHDDLLDGELVDDLADGRFPEDLYPWQDLTQLRPTRLTREEPHVLEIFTLDVDGAARPTPFAFQVEALRVIVGDARDPVGAQP